MNPDISNNVLFYENRNPFPLYNNSHRNREHHVNVLLIMDEKSGTYHYLLILSLSRLVDDNTKHTGATHVCPYCLYCFTEEHHLTFHIPECSIRPPQRLEYLSPRHDGDTEYNILQFKNFAKNLLCLSQWYYIDSLGGQAKMMAACYVYLLILLIVSTFSTVVTPPSGYVERRDELDAAQDGVVGYWNADSCADTMN